MIYALVRIVGGLRGSVPRARPRLIAILVAAALATVACSPSAGAGPEAEKRVPVNGGSYIDVPADRLNAMLAAKDFVLVNVHVPYEGELARTDAFIPFDQIGADAAALPADKTAKIVLYCRSGSMSMTAARTLVGLGYTNVYNLDGGLNGWKARGFQVLNKGS